MTKMPIEIKSLYKSFKGKRRQRVEAISALSLTISQGEVFGFLGPNGAGKSTTIKTLLGQIRPTSGTVSLFGQSSALPSSRARVGYLPENPAFYDFLTAQEYLRLVGRVYGMSAAEIDRASTRVLEALSLEEAAKRPIRGYSKGMVQRLGLAQTLLHDPDLLILDEPMSGLDPVGRALVKELILDLKKRGKTIFFSTHVIGDVEAVCDRVGIIAKGVLRAENVVAEIMQEGVDGYLVRLDQIPPLSLQQYLHHSASDELYVPRQEFNAFMRQVDEAGCSVHLVEPRRKSLEDFFLRIISQEY
jgi:ABC-2 type transport system ATP-binding protein